MQILKRAALVGAAAIAMGALPALSQTVTFTTAGSFTGTGCSTIATGSSCPENAGAWTLAFSNGSGNTLTPSLIDLGQFSVSCASASCAPANVTAGTTFTLTINQTAPSGGTGNFTGTITGLIAFNPDQSTLKWTPTTSLVTIGGVTYQLIVDNIGNFNIAGPNSGTGGANPNTTVVKALVSVPEPSTVGLMATGLFGLVPVALRRRRRR